MSLPRNDCEHGHGALVHELAAVIASDHGLTMKGAVLVILPAENDAAELEWPSRVFGKFNTAALAQAADAVLDMGEEHVPDGCHTCDSAGAAMAKARRYFRELYRALMEGSPQPPKSSKADHAFSAYKANPEILHIWPAMENPQRAELLAKDAFMHGAAWAMKAAKEEK